MKKLLFIFFSALFLFSCKKDKDATCTTTAASIAGAYKITAVTYRASATSPETDYFSIVFSDACERDDVFTFDVNGTYLLTDAGIVCSPPNTDNGNWSISGNTMTLDGDPASIESYNCQTLVLLQTDVQAAGDRFKITFTRQ